MKSSKRNQIPQDLPTNGSMVSAKNTVVHNLFIALAGMVDLMEGLALESTDSRVAPSLDVPSSSFKPLDQDAQPHTATVKKSPDPLPSLPVTIKISNPESLPSYGDSNGEPAQSQGLYDLFCIRSRERSHSPSKHKLVDRRSSPPNEERGDEPLWYPKHHSQSEFPELGCLRLDETGNKVFRRTMKELEKNHKPSIIVLMETKIDLSSMGSFFNKLGFTTSSHIDPVGRSRGIWVLWDPFKATVKALEVNAQVIHAKIQCNNHADWIISAVYASPIPRSHDLLWANLESVANNMNLPWFVAGGFQ
ncbi:hypothetical protein LOK49_LG04G01272 [Camellia lanceoleosa]|uniref:Uncharacterized protein n=1 Tax=Camellia lanceoleosa TaxID=1840588 RepID=A0ACC0HWD7_9ERIC|nr:hypothetical protein LOK49_LG04G01272 [Camellia lanceoleosa]